MRLEAVVYTNAEAVGFLRDTSGVVCDCVVARVPVSHSALAEAIVHTVLHTFKFQISSRGSRIKFA